jgi:mono/diheme cytochrome c family protein
MGRRIVKMIRIALLALSLPAWIFLAGCGGGGASSDRPASSSPGGTATSSSVSALDQGPRASEAPANEELAKQGEKLFQEKGCSACHSFGARATGPDLAGVSERRTAKWIENQILHPEKMIKEDPIARQLFAQFALQMPNQGLTEEQARAVIEFFKHRDHEAREDEEKD